MKKCLSLLVLVIAMCSTLSMATAQSPLAGGFGSPVYEPGTFRAFSGQVGRSLGSPGRVWVSGNYADRGLGYRGSYATVGAKTRLFEDGLDGRWLFEGRGHLSEEGGFFANLGIERLFTIDAAGADIGLGFWFDYDDDQDAFPFSDSYEAVGVSAKIKTRYWDLTANGYFPIGNSDTLVGDPNGGNPFFGNSISLVPGIDSALTGFDVTIRTRPEQLAFVNGTFDFGGYGYESDLIEFFGGGRIRMSAQLLQGVILTGELNYDDRFDATGLVGLTWFYGANARGNEYSSVGKDFEPTLRNDHIVRFNQDVVLAIDPDTGLAYNVIHVDNSANLGGDGSVESPFTTLAEAEAASGEDDIIFVRDGDGTVTGYDEGITLQDGQLFLADGSEHLIPIANGGDFGSFFNLFGDLDGVRPTITANNFGNAVTLASRNTVRGFNIDGTQAVAGLSNGIFGSAATVNNGGLIENNIITDAVLNGININNLAGDWRFADNNLTDNGFSGISLIDACDPTSVFDFENNVAFSNGLDGIQIINYDAAEINFNGDITDENGRDGIRLENFKGDPNVGIDLVFDGINTRENDGDGLSVIGGSGRLTVINSVIGTELDPDTGVPNLDGGNIGNGINIVDFTTPNPDDQVLIISNSINENGVGGGAGVNIELNEGFTRALITDNSIDGNGIGIRTRTDDIDNLNGIPSVLELQIIDNQSIGSFLLGGNTSDGLNFNAVGGSSQSILIENQEGVGLVPILNSGFNGISFNVGDDSGGVLSSINAVVRGVNVTGSVANGIFANVVDDGQLSLLIEESIINNNATGMSFNLDTNENGAINNIIVQNNTINDNVFDGVVLNTFDGTFTDFALINNVITNPALALAGVRTDGVPDGVGPDVGFGDGVRVVAIGDPDQVLNPQIDNRTRAFITGNFIDLFTLDGIDVTTFGDASVFTRIDGNVSNNNGDGFLTPGNGQADLPFHDGIALTANGMSSINARVGNNFATANAEFGVEVVTNGTSTINALFSGNNLNFNDITEDMNNMPIVDALGIDFVATNGLGSQMALSFTSNFLVGDILFNAGAPGDFIVELDGLSNGVAGTFALFNITQVGFGTVVEGLLSAEEAAFDAAGFPAEPPPILFP